MPTENTENTENITEEHGEFFESTSVFICDVLCVLCG